MVLINLMGIKLDPTESKQFSRLKVDVNCLNKIETLEQAAADGFKLELQCFDLMYCGNVLNRNEVMSKYGIKQGVTVHVMKKNEPIKPAIEPLEVPLAMRRFNKLRRFPFFFHKLQRFARRQIVQNILASKVPGLRNDLVALAYLHDPELLSQLTEEGVVEKLIKDHQPLIDAIVHLDSSSDTQITDTAANSQAPLLPVYILDSLSDHDVDSSSSDGEPAAAATNNAQPSQSTGEQSITAQQLAFALAQAVSSALGPNTAPDTPGTSSSSASNSAGVITNEMFTNAMQQAFANVSSAQQTTATSSAGANSAEISTEAQYATQLRQMIELGLTDTLINVQALQASGGDVQAAIDLVFSNFMSTDS